MSYVFCRRNDASTLSMLLDQGLDPNAEDMLYHACDVNAFECIKLLVKAGADINKVHKDGRVPLFELVDKPSRLPALKYLIEHKANVNQQTHNYGFTPLYFALLFSNIESARILLQNGAKETMNTHRCELATPFDSITNRIPGSDIWRMSKLLLEAGAKTTLGRAYPSDISHLIRHFNQFKRSLLTWMGVLKKRYKIRGIAPTDIHGRIPSDLVRLLSWYAWEVRYDGPSQYESKKLKNVTH